MWQMVTGRRQRLLTSFNKYVGGGRGAPREGLHAPLFRALPGMLVHSQPWTYPLHRVTCACTPVDTSGRG